jgi:glycosyltransferase involved in cell wall biosynthesis
MRSIDVIVPCYKYGRYLGKCVESVLSQVGVEVRVLVIDDASPDDSATVGAELARRDPRIQFVQHESNRGHIATYNEGIDWISREYTLLISADDYLLPGALSRATSLMSEHPEVSFAFGRALELYPNGTVKPFLTGIAKYDGAGTCIVPSREFIEMSTSANRVPTPTAVVRTSFLKRVGGYRPELPHTADMEMWLQLAVCGPVGIIGESQAVYRRHDANMSLGYVTKFIPDLEQRKAALDWFLRSSVDALDDVEEMRSRAYTKLSIDALSRAHRAIMLGDANTSRRLAEFASAIDPSIKYSALWGKLMVKQILGKRWLGLLKLASPSRCGSLTGNSATHSS